MAVVIPLFLIFLSFIVTCGQSDVHHNINITSTTPKFSFKLPLIRRNVTRVPPPPLSKNYFVSGVSFEVKDEYYTKFKVGSPPQSMKLNVDTGSSVSWVRCFECDFDEEVCSMDDYYHRENSESYYKLPCEACPVECNENKECIGNVVYADGTGATFVKALETIFITEYYGGNKSLTMSREIQNVSVGCAIQTNGFRDLDGSLGIGTGNGSFYSLLKYNYGVKVFSYCLVDKLQDKEASSDIIFGDEEASEDAIYTPMYHDYSTDHYSINLMGIKFEGQALAKPSLPTKMMIDTGTSVSCVPQSVYNALVEKFSGVANQLAWGQPKRIGSYYPCYTGIDQDKISESTTLTFTFKGDANLVFLPEHIWLYLERYNAACLAFLDSSKASMGRNILGNHQQQGIRVFLNQTGDHVVGFDLYNC